ncbi:MAG: ankyrin repeat domain-containing protein [Candidatus Babeliales bacterium]
MRICKGLLALVACGCMVGSLWGMTEEKKPAEIKVSDELKKAWFESIDSKNSRDAYKMFLDHPELFLIKNERGRNGLMEALKIRNYVADYWLCYATEGKMQELVDAGTIDLRSAIQVVDADGMTAMHYAATSISSAYVKAIIKLGAQVDVRTKPANCTPLMVAANNASNDVVQTLLDNKADVRAIDEQGRTALIYAIIGPQFAEYDRQDRVEIVDMLIKAGSDFNIQAKGGDTPLALAALRGFHEAIRALLTAHAEIDKQSESGATALILAAGKGKVDAVAALLDGGANPDVKTKNGETALDFAKKLKSERNKNKIITMLTNTEKKEAAEGKIPSATKNAWFGEIEKCNVATIKSMLQENPDLAKIKSSDGTTALMKVVVNEKCMDVLDDLIQKSDIDAQNNVGGTALMHAAVNGNVGAIRALIKVHADLERTDANGMTALMLAACDEKKKKSFLHGLLHGFWDALEELIKAKADVNKESKYGTALILATREECFDAVKLLLLTAGADKSLKCDGKIALDWAREKGNDLIIALLDPSYELSPEKRLLFIAKVYPYASPQEKKKLVHQVMDIIIKLGTKCPVCKKWGGPSDWARIKYEFWPFPFALLPCGHYVHEICSGSNCPICDAQGDPVMRFKISEKKEKEALAQEIQEKKEREKLATVVVFADEEKPKKPAAKKKPAVKKQGKKQAPKKTPKK